VENNSDNIKINEPEEVDQEQLELLEIRLEEYKKDPSIAHS
jgi:hypothetical protein